MPSNPEGVSKTRQRAAPCPKIRPHGKAHWGNGRLSFPRERTSERSSLTYSSGVCEKEAKTSRRLRNSRMLLSTNTTGEGWELRDRSGDRGCNPDITPPAQPSSRLSQLKPNSSRTLGRPLPATLLSANRKAGGTRGQDLRAREIWEQRKGSYSLRVDYFGRC